ncbi:MAG: PEBP family protein [Gemmatimonadota bacterium]
MRAMPTLLLLAATTACAAAPEPELGEGDIRVDVWADNWFAMYANGELIEEDATPFDTERSFDGASFHFDAELPIQVAVVVRDYIENDTGLEYIGRRNQQMGDGGFIAQFRDHASGEVLAVTDSEWACLVIHSAPLDRACEDEADPVAGSEPCAFRAVEKPTGWLDADFDDSGWDAAVEYSEGAVRPKGGYDDIDWVAQARLVWSDDLEIDNTLLCRRTISD